MCGCKGSPSSCAVFEARLNVDIYAMVYEEEEEAAGHRPSDVALGVSVGNAVASRVQQPRSVRRLVPYGLAGGLLHAKRR